MRKRALVIAGIVGVLLLAGAGGVYAYDQAAADRIGKGVKVGGVDVGGLTPPAAEARLRRAVLDPLNRPVVVRADGRRFTLPPQRAKVGVDIAGSVHDAVTRSRQGNIVARAWRGITGKSVAVDLELDVTYSEVSIDRLVKRVSGTLDKPAVDAHVDLEHGDLTPQASQDGRRVLAKPLKRAIRARLLDPSKDRTVDVRTKVVEPKITSDQLAERYPAILIVDRSAFKLTLYKNLELVKTYGIAVGAVGLETPAGLYHIQNKAVNPAWTMPNSDWVAPGDRGKVIPGGTPENPLKARWLGIFDGAGIHGTDNDGSIGSAASHGCVRMRIPDVIELYDQVPVGTPIYIA